MPATYAQGPRLMTVSTPAGPDKLLLLGFQGTEQISGPYRFELELAAAASTKLDFSQLLGKEFTVKLNIATETARTERYFSGICQRFSQGHRDTEFTYYRAELVPQFWLTTRTAQSRIFQQKSVPDILKKVLTGLTVKYELDGTFEKREYCVQYRETDFNFVSRLMEEEGIFYYFEHKGGSHEMVIANSPRVHTVVPGLATVHYDTMERKEQVGRHVHEWVKLQDIRSGKYTLWDQTFQRPGDNFESTKNTLDSVTVGTVAHKLKVAGNDKMELYDFPGEFAQRFDGIDTGGADQAASLGKISPDGTRTAELRMQAESVAGLVVEGSSNCSQFTTGHKFTLDKHFDAQGDYLLTTVQHSASYGTAFRSGADDDFVYSNQFTCIPVALPFRPQRTTPKPVIAGVQTAIVVGPSGEEIFTDKYGRVKVQFPWDRESKADANSSCWLRVGTPWAGKGWGSIHIPRIGQEVIVQFLEGDPDAPIVVGSVYNAGSMPPYKLPDKKTKSTLKSNSSKGGGGFNEIRFEDDKGKEQIFVHAEKQRDLRVKKDNLEWIGENEHLIVNKDRSKNVKGDEHNSIGGCRNESVGESESLKVGQNLLQKVGMNMAVDAGMEIHLKAGMTVVIEAGMMMTLKAGGAFITLGPSGVAISGPIVMINSGGAAGSGSGCSPTPPGTPKEADDGQAGSKDEAAKARTAPAQMTYSPTAVALQAAAQSGAPFCAVSPPPAH